MQQAHPAWIDALPEDQRDGARAKFLLRLAALYYSPDGQLKTLSTALGLNPGSLASYDTIPPNIAVSIEDLLGREVCPRELLRPDLFRIAE